jgi:hypothetical protein
VAHIYSQLKWVPVSAARALGMPDTPNGLPHLSSATDEPPLAIGLVYVNALQRILRSPLGSRQGQLWSFLHKSRTVFLN